jgi:hypothetical protein
LSGTRGGRGEIAYPFDQSDKAWYVIPRIGCWIDVDFGLAINQPVFVLFAVGGCCGALLVFDLDHRTGLTPALRGSVHNKEKWKETH